jgi:hypothetical protein
MLRRAKTRFKSPFIRAFGGTLKRCPFKMIYEMASPKCFSENALMLHYTPDTSSGSFGYAPFNNPLISISAALRSG